MPGMRWSTYRAMRIIDNLPQEDQDHAREIFFKCEWLHLIQYSFYMLAVCIKMFLVFLVAITVLWGIREQQFVWMVGILTSALTILAVMVLLDPEVLICTFLSFKTKSYIELTTMYKDRPGTFKLVAVMSEDIPEVDYFQQLYEVDKLRF